MPTGREFQNFCQDREYMLLDAHLRVRQFIVVLYAGHIG